MASRIVKIFRSALGRLGFGRNGHGISRGRPMAYWQAMLDGSILPDAVYTDWVNESSRLRKADMVARARWFEANSALANRLARVFVDYTVGPNGLLCVPNSSSERFNNLATEIWRATMDSIFLRPLGQNGWAGALSAVAWRWFFDGEIYLYTGIRRDGSPFVQAIEAQNVATPPRKTANTIVDGVEIDRETGEPLAYWVREAGGSFRRLEAAQVIHVFDPARAGEYRGTPLIAPVLSDLLLLADLEMLERRSLQAAADLAVVLKLNAGEFTDVDIRAQLLGFAADSPEEQAQDISARYEAYKKIMGGRTIALQKDEDAQIVVPNRPSTEQLQFWTYLVDKICAGVNTPSLLVLPPRQAQGTVVRAQVEAANNYFRSAAQVMMGVVRRIYEHVMRAVISLKYQRLSLPADYLAVSVRAPKQITVDAGYTSAAMINELAAGATHWELIYAPMGLDAREELRKKADLVMYIRQLAEERGLNPSEIASAAGAGVTINRRSLEQDNTDSSNGGDA
ncbi:MAG: phage portal protein [Caldilinea sp.]|uniref:phage portal protein n=1 Tax=Caldilinea sp. TaxID=2293560 RepID=UPI0030983260